MDVYVFVVHMFRFLLLFCDGRTPFHPKRCLGGNSWAKAFGHICLEYCLDAVNKLLGKLFVDPQLVHKKRSFVFCYLPTISKQAQ